MRNKLSEMCFELGLLYRGEEAFAMAYKFYETREIMGFNPHGARL